MPLDVIEFIRRYLHHVLPSGFMKIRYYGFMGSGSSVTLDDIRALIELSLDLALKYRSQTKRAPERPSPYYPYCGGHLEYRYSILPHELWQPG